MVAFSRRKTAFSKLKSIKIGTHKCLIYWYKTMEGTKARKAPVEDQEPAKLQTELWKKVRVLDSELGDIDELSINDEFDGDTDPYNSTGSHVILEMKKYADDE